MTCRPDPEAFAAGRRYDELLEAKIRSRRRMRDAQPSPAGYARLAALFRSVVVGLRWCTRRYLRAFDISRRWQAAIERAKHCDLIYDPTTGIVFALRPDRDPCVAARKCACSEGPAPPDRR
jgi:hypothetical protein